MFDGLVREPLLTGGSLFKKQYKNTRMPKATVTIASGFNYQGKRLLKGEETPNVSELQIERWERLGYAKAVKSTTKAAPAKKVAAKKVVAKAAPKTTVTSAPASETK